MKHSLGRREFLGAALGAGAGLMLPRGAAIAAPATGAGFRFVHMTDIHIQPELRAGEGLAACLKAVEKLDPKPDFILTGGDLVMDVFEQDHARAKLLFDLYLKTVADQTGLKVFNSIGNHDVFGWSLKNGITPQDPLYGKQMARERLGLEKTYYAFDHKGWRFYALDSIQPGPNNGYLGGIDEEQMAWLEADLAAKPAATPAVVVTHIPILTVTLYTNEAREFRDNAYHLPAGGMCAGTRKLSGLFQRHGVKLALSGHIHELDRIDYRGVAYICDGAVCGGWWKGPNNDYVQEGFGVIDLGADGKIAHQYVDYGWEAKG